MGNRGPLRRWTEREDRTLRQLCGILDIDLIAERLGRTAESIKCRRKRLGLGKFTYHDWTPDQIDAVRRHPHGAKRKPLADALGLDVGRVGSMISSIRRKDRFGVSVNAA